MKSTMDNKHKKIDKTLKELTQTHHLHTNAFKMTKKFKY